LIDLADGFIILAGRAGTLAELSILWALQRAGALDRPRVVEAGGWGEMMDELGRLGILGPDLWRSTPVAKGAEEAVTLLLGALRCFQGEPR
jgi:hypothetical protein